MLFPLLGNPSKWGYLHTRRNGNKSYFGIWHFAPIKDFSHLSIYQKRKKKHFTKEEIGCGEDKACNECGYAEGMWGHAPRTVMSVRT